MSFFIISMYILLFVFFVLCIYLGYVNYRDTHRFIFVEYLIESPKIKREMLIPLLSDLHSQSYGPGNEKLIRAILSKKPYCVLSCGDLYTSSKKASIEPALDLLEGLSLKVPVIISEGNHESKTRIQPKYFKGRYEDYCNRVDEISKRGKGIVRLLNESAYVLDPDTDEPLLCVTGFSLENQYFKHFRHVPLPKGYIYERLSAPSEDMFNVLLAHNPLYSEYYAEWGADLVLSGHLHGGVVRLPHIGGVLCPDYSLFPKYDGGVYSLGEGRTRLIVSKGLGTHTIPIRLWNPAEIPLIRLKPAQGD